MNKLIVFIVTSLCGLLTACAPIKNAVNNQYKLETFSAKKIASLRSSRSILVSQPDAIPGYQTEQMLYVDKQFELSSFAHNAWISSPANMLYPLITQSLQHSHYFYAVASGPDADKTDYRLDTQLIALQQNFLTKPSKVELIANVVLTHISDGRIVASRIFNERVPCSEDTPYGGVVAANKAALTFTNRLTQFVVKQVQTDNNKR